MLDDREYMVAVLKSLKDEVETRMLETTNRMVQNVVVYTEPTPIAQGGYVTVYAYRNLENGSGNGGILRLGSKDEIENRLRGDRRTYTELYMVNGEALADEIDDNYNTNVGSSRIDSSVHGRNGGNLMPTIGVLVEELEDAFVKFVGMLREQFPGISILDYMYSSATFGEDLVNSLGGYIKVGRTFQAPCGIFLKVENEYEDGNITTTIGLANDLKRATKNDLV